MRISRRDVLSGLSMIGLVAVPVLAWVGRPADKPIMTSAVVPGAVERLTTEGIVRARYRDRSGQILHCVLSGGWGLREVAGGPVFF